MTLTRPNPIPALIVLALLCAAALAVALPLIQLQPHAEARHGDEAWMVRNCGDIVQIWLNKSCERFNLIKSLVDGRYGDQVIHPRCGNSALEITAYIFTDLAGKPLDLAAVERVMLNKGCVKVYP